MSLIAQAIADGSYMPHGMCYLWQPPLLWLHVASDFLTGVAYYAIPPSLLVLVLRARHEVPEGADYVKRRLPHEWMYIAFGLFIVACGTTHFLGAWNVWNADYWFAGGVKAVTAFASLAVAITLPPLIPKALGLVRDARASEVKHRQLTAANAELTRLNARLYEMSEMRTRFFANVSHELRTPLALIVGPVAQQLRQEGLDEDLRDDLETVRRNALLLQKRVDDLLDLARTDAGQASASPEPVDAAEIVRMTVERFGSALRDKRVEIEAQTPETLQALLDGAKFERIVDNLVSNAMKFTPDGGRVRVRLASAGGTILLFVDDSGPGIPEEQRSSIFERFRQLDSSTRRRSGGVGLGLSIVRDFARLEGGDVRVGDSPLGGSRFEVQIPLRRPEGNGVRPWISSPVVAVELEAEAPVAREQPREAVAPGTAPRVLIVEDNAEMRRLSRRILETEFECAVADSGASALVMLERWTPEVVVTDVMMPVMDGFELLRRMRERPELEDTPVLVLSALADQEVHARMLREGAQDYVTKPFAPDELRARVSNLAVMKRTRETLRRELNSREADIDRMAEELGRRRRELAKALEEVTAARDRAAAANEAKTNFLAVMSHELRTPLNAILGYGDLLDLGLPGELNEAQREHVGRIRGSTKHLQRTIDDILLYARTEPRTRSGFPRPVRLPAYLDDVLGMLRPEADRKGITLTIVADDVEVMADRDRLVHVLMNLVSNAVKFTDEGEVTVTAEVDRKQLRVVVEDTGPGIPPEYAERIFEPFWQADMTETREQGGSGLGLSIARRFARELGGDIEVESREGEGSRFTFWMPVKEAGRVA